VLRLLEQNAPLVQRTNGVVVPPAGSASGAGSPVRGALRGALSGASRTARERPSRRPVPARLPPSRARFVAVPALLLSVVAVRARV